VFRAALGRPALSGAAALAVVSAAAAAGAALTGGHGVHLLDSADAASSDALTGIASSDTALSDPSLMTGRASVEGQRSSVAAGEFRARMAQERHQAVVRAARNEQRRALHSRNPRVVARAMLGKYGWGASQFSCLNSLWLRESEWSISATNPTSGAYGIPQALPGSKMASAGHDWRTNPLTQISWGLGYIRARYGTPCGAWAHSQASGWY
jgi:hypothetical protein